MIARTWSIVVNAIKKKHVIDSNEPFKIMKEDQENKDINRRDFLKKMVQAGVVIGVGALAYPLFERSTKRNLVWQLDPSKCIQCGRCASSCIKTPSAVKCFHVYDMCGYCDLCGGYFRPGTKDLTTGAENLLCPTNAIKRKFIEEPFFEYDIDKELCIGCAKCVAGCGAFGNGSLQIQVDHELCDNCNQCSIAQDCPADAFTQIPAGQPYLLLGMDNNTKK